MRRGAGGWYFAGSQLVVFLFTVLLAYMSVLTTAAESPTLYSLPEGIHLDTLAHWDARTLVGAISQSTGALSTVSITWIEAASGQQLLSTPLDLGEAEPGCPWRSLNPVLAIDPVRLRVFLGCSIFALYSPETGCQQSGFALARFDVTEDGRLAAQNKWVSYTLSSDLPEPYSASVHFLRVLLESGDIVLSGNYQGPTWFGGSGVEGSAFPMEPAAWDTATAYVARLGADGVFRWVTGSGGVNENGLDGVVVRERDGVVSCSVGGVGAERWVFPGETSHRLFSWLPGGTGSMLAHIDLTTGFVKDAQPYILCNNTAPRWAPDAITPASILGEPGAWLLLWSSMPAAHSCVIGESAPSSWETPAPLAERIGATELIAIAPPIATSDRTRVIYSLAAIPNNQTFDESHREYDGVAASFSAIVQTDETINVFGSMVVNGPFQGRLPPTMCVNITARDADGNVIGANFSICVPDPARPVPWLETRYFLFEVTVDAATGAVRSAHLLGGGAGSGGVTVSGALQTLSGSAGAVLLTSQLYGNFSLADPPLETLDCSSCSFVLET